MSLDLGSVKVVMRYDLDDVDVVCDVAAAGDVVGLGPPFASRSGLKVSSVSSSDPLTATLAGLVLASRRAPAGSEVGRLSGRRTISGRRRDA